LLLPLSRPRGNERVIKEVLLDQQLWQGMDFEALPEVQLLQGYVRIDTSHPDPNEVAGAEFLAAQLGALGVQATIERLGEKKANLWAIVEGETPEALVLHNHIDVEPLADPSKWDYPPFGAVVDGPWIYGRGIYDMKSLAVAQLEAVAAVVRSGQKPRRSLIFLATSGEELGSETGTIWILRQHPELKQRMWAVLTEGGVVETLGPREVKYFGVEFAQKSFASLEVCSSDRAALEALAQELWVEAKSPPRRQLPPEIRTFLEAYGPTRSAEHVRRLLAQPDELIRRPATVLELPPYLLALFRDEIVPNPKLLQEEDGTWTLQLSVHLLPQSELQVVVAELLPPWRLHGFAATSPRLLARGGASPLGHPVFQEAVRVVQERYPQAPVGPHFLPWSSTDARFFRQEGIPSYGFSPFLIAVTDTMRVGRANERMQLPGFVQGLPLYRELVRRLVEL
jgi:acetylornithine deacetylase/succinyl-diaminopimelate desuccinylase-like protein